MIGELVERTMEDLLAITNFGQEVGSTRSSSAWTSAGCRSARGTEPPCRQPPSRGRRFGGSSVHQKSMMGNLVASLIAAESISNT